MTAPESAATTTRDTFAGWVPTIAGQLSFSLIGLGTNSSDCVTANVETYAGASAKVPTRHVLVYQERVARDLPMPLWLAKRVRPWVRTHFILVGSSAPANRPRLDLDTENKRYQLLHDEIGVLKGKIYMVPYDQDVPKATQRFLQVIKARIGEIERATPRGTICGSFDLAAEFDLVPVAAAAEGVVFAECDFELYRSGEVRLHFDAQTPAYAEAVDDAEEADETDEGLISGLSKQAYYFIKDISHRHFHHDASSDNILPAFRVRDGDDDGWRRDSLWSLSRAVLEHRRRNALLDHKRALGILAYAESFQAHLACVRRAADGGFEPSEAGMSFDFSHTRASLGATIDELAFKKSFGLSVIGTVLATALAAIALWIGAVQISDSLCSADLPCEEPVPPRWLTSTLAYVIEHPAVGLGIITIALVIWVVKTQRGIAQARLVKGFQHVVGGWVVALGASASRWARKKHPTFGDNLGGAVAWLMATITVLGILFAVGGVFSLNPVWPTGWTIESWAHALADNRLFGWNAGAKT